MKIVGAGMAGLIAANYFRKQNVTVYEKQAGLPSNHEAVLRFRTDKVFKICGLPSKVVKVRKCIVYGQDFMSGPNPYLANMYSLKVTGKAEDRSIWNMTTEERHIAPADFIPRLADGCNIRYETDLKELDADDKIISTIPMPVLMKTLHWKDIPEFNFRPIWAITADVPGVDINQTIYFPELEVPYYRASFVGGRFIIECVSDPDLHGGPSEIFAEVIDYFGLSTIGGGFIEVKCKHQPLGKMLPIDDQLRKEFMHFATQQFGIYSLGRFATWRPLLLDDVVDDLAVIERMMNSNYEASRLNSGKV